MKKLFGNDTSISGLKHSVTGELPDHISWLFDDPMAEVNAVKLKMLQAGQELFDLSMINPDLMPPRFLVDKLLEASVKASNHRYAVSRGIRQLREAFAHLYREKFNVNCHAETQVCITMGSKEGLLSVLSCLANSPAQGGSSPKVLLGAPSYPAHFSAAKVSGLDCDFFTISDDEDLMLAEIQAKLKTLGPTILILNFPNNPTGICVSKGFYTKLFPIVNSGEVFVINDFVYGEMGFRDKTVSSMLSVEGFKEIAVETYSLSKAYSVPGWRVGGIVGCSEVVERVSKLKSHTDYGVFLPLQFAAAAALMSGEDLVKTTTQRYERRCQLMRRGLERCGWKVREPDAGASIWVKIPEFLLGAGSLDCSKRLLQETGILVLPGVVFGPEFDGYVRMAAVLAEERIHQALFRIEEFSRQTGESSSCR